MPTLNTTPNQGYQLPFGGNDLSVDVARVISAISAIDVDIANALAALASKAGLASPAFTGTPTAPTAAPGTDTSQLATTAFVKAALDALIGGAPGALDTLNELAAAIGDDADYAASMVASLATKLDKEGGEFVNGTIDNTPIGATTPAPGKFTTGEFNGLATLKGAGTAAQLRLERTGTSAGHAYLGADDSYLLRILDNSLNHKAGFDRQGRILLPNHPRFFAIKAGGSNQVTSGVVEFASEQVDIGGWYNSGAYNAVAPVAGTYEFSASIFWYLPAANAYAFGYFCKNAASFGQVCHSAASTSVMSYMAGTYATMIELAQGDYVDFRLAGAANGGGIYSGSYSTFSGKLLG
jgi:hypothetical protein